MGRKDSQRRRSTRGKRLSEAEGGGKRRSTGGFNATFGIKSRGARTGGRALLVIKLLVAFVLIVTVVLLFSRFSGSGPAQQRLPDNVNQLSSEGKVPSSGSATRATTTATEAGAAQATATEAGAVPSEGARTPDSVCAYLAKLKGSYDAECRALVELAQATKYEGWAKRAGWLEGGAATAAGGASSSTVHHCKWEGIHCSPDSKVKEVYLMKNHLDGTLPASLGALTGLSSMYVDQNRITGTLPDALQQLTDLENLQASDNQIEGTLPSWFAGMQRLKDLYLSNNKLGGQLFSTARLPALRELVLHHNVLSGTIPADLGLGHPALEHVSISHNALSGAIPDLSGLPQLQYLHLDHNELSGLDDTLCKLPASIFEEQECYIASNKFSCSDYPKCLLGKCDGGSCARQEL